MALHSQQQAREDRLEASREQHVAGLIREAEMAARNPHMDEGARASLLEAIRGQVAAYGGDVKLVPGAGDRAKRTSGQAAARRKPGRPRKTED
jgi:hypothetical protein